MFRYQMIVRASPKNRSLFFTEWSPAKIQPAITSSFSAGEFRRQPALSDSPVNGWIQFSLLAGEVQLWSVSF